MTVKFLDLHKQYLSMKAEIDKAIADVIAESSFIGGPRVTAFEESFAAYQGAKYCVAMANGTDAIEIALESLELPPGSEVLVPANSFIASSEAVTRGGHRVVFCDCNPENYTISVPDARKKITPKTKAVIAVHLYGHPCDMDGLQDMAREFGLKIIEDCAQSHGAEYKGRRVGAIGDAGTFSFYPGKNLGAYGDGGAMTTNSEAVAKKARMIANHGRTGKYDHIFEGRNSRLDGLQAAILSVKLKHLDGWIARRIEVADFYRKSLEGLKDIVSPKCAPWAKHVYHLFVVRVSDREGLKKHLEGKGVQTGVHYPIALPKLKAYDYLGQGTEKMRANEFDSALLSLPIGEHLERDELKVVADAVASFYR